MVFDGSIWFPNDFVKKHMSFDENPKKSCVVMTSLTSAASASGGGPQLPVVHSSTILAFDWLKLEFLCFWMENYQPILDQNLGVFDVTRRY